MATSFQTPPRQVPGIWPPTPATTLQPSLQPAHRPSFLEPRPSATSLTTIRPSEPPAQQPINRTAESLKPAERAARSINESLNRDARFPELDGIISQGVSSEYDVQTSNTWAPFQKVRMYNIPDQIFEQYNRAQMSTSMGLFAELKYAWVAIDNALYLWDYTVTNPELLGFEEQSHSIVGVHLATPRPGVFLPTIKHMIVLATTSDVILLGLGTDPNPGGSSALTLFQTGMSTSVKGLDISVIAHSVKTGRVFFAGRTENELYELNYQQEDRWFSSKCYKVCHTSSKARVLAITFSIGVAKQEFVEQIVVDDTRDLVYTLSSTSTIRVFHMKQDATLPLVISKSAVDTYGNIAHLITPSESLNPQVKIVSISALPAQEASRYHLMATTATGYRIYLSATSSGYWTTNKAGPPVSMQAQHVKTPPMISSNTNAQPQQGQAAPDQPPSIHQPIRSLTLTRLAQRFPPGYFFCFTTPDANSPTDNLFISAPDAARLAQGAEPGQQIRSAESAIWLSLASRAEDIGLCQPYMAPTVTTAGYGNDLAIQFDKPIPEVAILTNNGIHIIKRRRLVDVFAALIRQGGGSEGFQNQVNNMVRTYGRIETLSTALAVACGQGIEVTQDSRSLRVNDPEVLEIARKTFIDYGGKPSISQNAIPDRSAPLIDAVKPSPRHSAISLYISRLLRSTWKAPISVETTTVTGYQVIPAVPLEKLKSIQEDLSALQRFFNTNKSFIKGLSGPDDLSRTSSKDDEIALQGEHRALHSLVRFVSDAIEGISFVLVLFEERVAEIVPLLPETSRPLFHRLTFEDLFSTPKGFDLAKELVKAIVNRNITKGSNVETVAESLRRRCGSFCSADDVIIFKAQEQLKRAAEAGTNVEYARNLLNESLKLFEQVAPSLPNDYLQSAIRQYTELQFFAGAIKLVLRVADEKDKANDALSWMTDGRPEPDARKARFDLRNQCYDLVHDVVIAVDKSTEQAPGFVDGRPSLQVTRRNEAYDIISRSKDEAFLTNLYDWYLAQGWSDRLLATESSFIPTYLQRKSANEVTYANLLWKYYGQTGQFHDAARIQLQLAQSGFELSLDKRIEYLSRARANASTFMQGGNRKVKQRLLQEISELLDVANIQDELLQRLKDDPRLPSERREEVLKAVDGPVHDITTLFNDYADNAGYYDICLLIYQVADHRDASQIKQTWQQLLQSVHDRTEATGEPQPFEAIAEEVRSLGAKLRLSETTFPVPTLLPILERYSFEHQRAVAPPHWVVDIFLELEVSYENLFDGLDTLFYSSEGPFVGSNRKFVASDIIYIVRKWYHDTTKAGGFVFGSETGAARVDEMMAVLVEAGRSAGIDDDMLGTARAVRAEIAKVV